jgi:hypothetical protein
MEDLMRVVTEQQQQISQLLQRTTPQAQAQPEGAQPQDAGPPVPNYMFEIPDPLLEGLRSEDPGVQRAAYAHLIAGAAQEIHRQMQGTLSENLGPVIEQRLRATIQEESRRKAMHDDFYGTYKFLDVPRLKPMVAETANQVAAEWRTSQWSPQMRDEVYRRVVESLRSVATAAGGIPQPQGPPSVPASGAAPAAPTPAVLGNLGAAVPQAGQPPVILEPGVRPGLRQHGAVADEIEELLF